MWSMCATMPSTKACHSSLFVPVYWHADRFPPARRDRSSPTVLHARMGEDRLNRTRRTDAREGSARTGYLSRRGSDRGPGVRPEPIAPAALRMGANVRLDDLHDLIRHKANLLVICECGKQHIYDASRFCRYAMARSSNTYLAALGHRIRCDRCNRRHPRLRATAHPPTPADPFPRTEQEWKHLTRRLRG